jgi:hypothetical protein
MNLKKELGLEDNEKGVIFIAGHDGVYVCESGLVYEDFIDDICYMEIKDNTLYIYCLCDEKYYFSLDKYDVYYTEMANQVVVAFEPVKIETDEELNS